MYGAVPDVLATQPIYRGEASSDDRQHTLGEVSGGTQAAVEPEQGGIDVKGNRDKPTTRPAARVVLRLAVLTLILAAIAAPTKADAAPAASLPPTWVTYPLSYSGVPNDLRLGADGQWWVPEQGGNAIDRLTMAGIDSPIASSPTFNGPRITAGSDGNMWMTSSPNNFFTGEIDKLSTSTGAVLASYPTSPDASGRDTIPIDIVLGPDGNVWYTTRLGATADIVRVTPGGVQTRFSRPVATSVATQALQNLAVGPDGNLWTTDTDESVDRITPSGAFTIFPRFTRLDGTPSSPLNLTAGPDGNVWYTDLGSGKPGASGEIGRITPAGVVTHFALPPGVAPSSIVTGLDGNLWFSDDTIFDTNVGRITPSGQVGFFDASSTGSFPTNIAGGPDGRIWLAMTTYSSSSLAAFQPFTPTPSLPDIHHISAPYSGPSGGGQIVLTGYGLGAATGVMFGSTPATSFSALGPSQLAVTVPPHAIGPVDLTVTTPDGTSPTSAATQFFYQAPQCGMVITQSTQLSGDIGPCYSGLTVAANNITLDLGGFRLFGFQTPRDGSFPGIDLVNRSGATVQDGTVSGFDAGVHIAGGSGNTVAQMNIQDNIGPNNVFTSEFGDGIMIEHGSRNNQIVHNVVNHNGVFDGIGVFDGGSDGNTIAFNTVENTVGPPGMGPAGEGIIINGASGSGVSTAIRGTVVEHNVVSNSASGGIANINEIGGTIEYNTVTGSGATNSFGNGIGVQVGFNWSLGETHMVIAHNQVSGNGVDGIRLGGRFGFFRGSAEGNTVAFNIVTDNATNVSVDVYEGGRRVHAYDLHDNDPTCGTNIWSKNTWGSAGFTPACTSTGGTGPGTSSGAAAPQASPLGAAAPNTADPTTTFPNAQQWEAFLERGRG